jgi:sporulation protein YlmC with PRC-barrel domain
MRIAIWIMVFALVTGLEYWAYRPATNALGMESEELVRAGDLEEHRVLDRYGAVVGEVEDVLVDPETGIVEYLLIEGEGGAERLAPFDALELDGDVFRLDIEEDAFERAPEFGPGLLDEPGYLDEVDEHYDAD